MDENRLHHYQAWIRVGIILATVLSLHNTIYTAISIAAGIQERKYDAPVVYGTSPVWLILWLIILIAVVWRGRPQLSEWGPLFTLVVCFWFVGAAGTNWHPDTPEESEVAAFASAMFIACFCLWGLALLLAFARWLLRILGMQK